MLFLEVNLFMLPFLVICKHKVFLQFTPHIGHSSLKLELLSLKIDLPSLV